MTVEPGDAPAGYELLLPPGWWRIPAEPVAARRSIRTLLDRRLAHLPRDEVAAQRAELEARLRDLVSNAQEIGAVDVLVPVDPVGGLPVAASCVVTIVPGSASVAALAARMGEGAEEHEVVEIAGRPAVRVRRLRPVPDEEDLKATVIEHVVPVPGGAETLVLSWSTPMAPFAEALTELFDAVAASLRWRWA